MSEAEFGIADAYPQEDPSPGGRGAGGGGNTHHARHLPPCYGEEAEKDEREREREQMQSRLVQLERLCAEKDSLIKDLEAEVRRLDGALGEETTFQSDSHRLVSEENVEPGSLRGGERLSDIVDISSDSAVSGGGKGKGRLESAPEGGEEELRSLVEELMIVRRAHEREKARADEAESKLAAVIQAAEARASQAEELCADLKGQLEDSGR